MKTKIEWTEYSWNPVTGCSEVSQGCNNCYAKRFAKRLQAMGNPRYKDGFNVCLHHDQLDTPSRWKTRRHVFVNSMSDIFHDDVPDTFIQKIFDVMNSSPKHTFQVLTKRSNRMSSLATKLSWTDNIWLGVTVEDYEYISRIEDLRRTDAKVKFISFEPLLGPIKNVSLEGINWVIVGGESGPKARPMSKEWVISLRDQCLNSGIPFFFKQWGGFNKKSAGRLLDGKIWSQLPQKVN